MRIRAGFKAISALALMLAGASGAKAQTAPNASVANFYSGREVNIVVGYSAGGGFDIYARLLGQFISKYIPGHPRVVVQNMPGAGGLKAALYILNAAPRDGTFFGTTGRTVFFAPMLSDVKFDGTQFAWLGSITDDFPVCLASSKSAVQSWDDMQKTTFVGGGIGPEDDLDIDSNFLKHIFGAKIKLVTGYPGSNDIKAAIERGELEGLCGISYSTMLTNYASDLKTKAVKVFLRISLKKSDALPDVTYLGDIATPEQRKVLQLLLDPFAMSRPFAAPPQIPAERLAALQHAFDQTMQDPEFLAEAKRANLPINPMNAADVKNLVVKLYGLPKSITDQSKQAIAYDNNK